MIIPSENTGFLGDMNDIEGSLPRLLVDFICESELVRRLKYLQKSLDPLDIEGLNRLIKDQTGVDLLHTDDEALLSALGGEVSLSEYQTFIDAYLSNGSVCPIDVKTPLRTYIIAYLLSASFKDCSMIITINQHEAPTKSPRPTKEEEDRNPTKQESKREIKAFLVDVDVKSITRLKRYAKLDRDLVESFDRFAKEGGEVDICKEAEVVE